MESVSDLNIGDVVVQDLSREECLALLASAPVGRIGVVAHGRPFVFPVNYILDGETVVFRTDPGTKLEGAGFGWVSFEIDGIDADAKLGWSVIVQGVGTEITSMIDSYSGKLRELQLLPWASGEKAHWIAIQAESVTGRRLSRR